MSMGDSGAVRADGPMRPYVKIATLAVLILVLLIPLAMIDQLTGERARSREKAVQAIGDIWGHPQAVVGPILVLPYKAIKVGGKAHLFVLPSRLAVQAALRPEERYRGIYRTTVYRSDVELAGRFSLPDFEKLGVPPTDIDWSKAYLSIGLRDPRSLTVGAATYAGRKLDFLSGSGVGRLPSGIHALTGPPPAGGNATASLPFRIRLQFAGRQRLAFSPVGRETEVAMTSPWRHPAFDGRYLPTTREIGPDGFVAKWRISYLGRGFPEAWTYQYQAAREGLGGGVTMGNVRRAAFGVSLVTPVDFYLKTERATKYGIMLIVLVVAAIFIFEVVGHVRFHPVEYGLVGLTLVQFFLLLLSFAEVLGFAPAYVLAALMSVGAIAAYAAKVLRSWRRGGLLGLLVAAAYGYGFVLLQLEDFALVSGAVGIFVVLLTVMFVTRNVDWSSLGGRRPDASGAATTPPAG